MKIGILTDIHENVKFLSEALSRAENHGCDELACLGDIVGYDTRFYNYPEHRSAGKCIEMVKANFRWVVAGNHDLNATGRIPSFSNGFSYPENWFTMTVKERKIVSRGKVWYYENEAAPDIAEQHTEFLKNIPEYHIPEISECFILLSHYIFPDLTGSTTMYIERNRQLKAHWDFMQSRRLKISFIGHSHSTFAGFAYRNSRNFLKAFHSIPNDEFILDGDQVVILLPSLSGEKGKTGFSIFDTTEMSLKIISIV